MLPLLSTLLHKAFKPSNVSKNMADSSNLDRLSGEYVDQELKRQSVMLTEDLRNPEFRAKYLGKAIAYYNHEVLAEDKGLVGVCVKIPAEKRKLWVVIRMIASEEMDKPEFMGGPKG